MLTENPKISPDDKEIFECTDCQIITRNKKDYKKHILTKKHKKMLELTKTGIQITEKSPDHYCSACKKKYKSRVGLWKHNKICSQIIEESVGNSEFKMLTELFKMQMNENKELKELIVDKL